jgi:hypothetical protein
VSLIYQSFVEDRQIAVYELERGMLMREERLCKRIMAKELSREFVIEIAESTLPFRSIENLMSNILGYHEWPTEMLGLKCEIQKIMKACSKVARYDKVPPTAAYIFGLKSSAPLEDEDVCVEPYWVLEPQDYDDEGRGVKRYPHTYECILYPWMYEVYKKQDSYEKRKKWEKRVNKDGSPRVMDRRVEEAQKELPF